MTISLGAHKTQGGHHVLITRLAQMGPAWVLKGAVQCPFTLAYHLNCWSLSGESLRLRDPHFNIQAFGEEFPQCAQD